MPLQIIAENLESTVLAEYVPPYTTRERHYQSEQDLEKHLIEQLQAQAYERLCIHHEDELIRNLRVQLEHLNDIVFTESEWQRFFQTELANSNQGIIEKTRMIQEDYIRPFVRENGSLKNIYLIDKNDIHNNHLQVINQYTTEKGKHTNRYDVTILVNGLPIVHIELKRRGVPLKEAFNQIDRYQRDSFWSGCGLFQYVQIFVISNGTQTKYYSNTTRDYHIKSNGKNKNSNTKKSSHSFEFTSWWADATNRPILDIVDFCNTFFAKHTLLNILTKYCVFTSDQVLLVMRPYQIVATERILNRIKIATQYKYYGTVKAGGYIWHTTGSGKTLTSFKTAQLVSKLPEIAKVIFVVDRKDLDYQTMKEYDKFQKDAANGNTDTRELQKQLDNPDAKIIITTIQKLSVLIKKHSKHDIFNQAVVLIFDECHRSQFGQMHNAITKTFKKHYLFGFTGTPIFAVNASMSGKVHLRTTEQAFGDKLHTYTIVNAINDKNVLPFRVDYISTMKDDENMSDGKVWDIDRERALSAPERIQKITQYILENFNIKTKRYYGGYDFNRLLNIEEVVARQDKKKVKEIRAHQRLHGFNAIFAVSSIDTAKLYYQEFKKQQTALIPDARLKIATIFSYGANDPLEALDGMDDENSENTNGLSQSHRDFLEEAIQDYNQMFGTSYDTSSERFQNYYKDVSQRMKNRDIDLLIVVNMFLTGFDATTLNTLWVDKNLRMHGLLQAYSRTNRILNSIKTFGNIVCFRNLEKATNDCMALFGDKEARGIVLLKTFNDYYNGYHDGNKTVPGYVAIVNELLEKFPLGEIIMGEKAQKAFIRLFGSYLKLRNILGSFDQFAGQEILTPRDVQDYHSMYLDLYQQWRSNNGADKTNINDDVVFEIELVKQVEINIDYILELIKQYHEKQCKDKEIGISINKAIDSSLELRDKKELIHQFIETLNPKSNIDQDWCDFVNEQRQIQLEKLINDENLNPELTKKFIDRAFKLGEVPSVGEDLSALLPNTISLFSDDHEIVRKRVLERIKVYFDRFWDISNEC